MEKYTRLMTLHERNNTYFLGYIQDLAYNISSV